MKEQPVHSSVGCGLESLKDSLFLSSFSINYDVCQEEEDAAFEDRELKDVCSFSEDDDQVVTTKALEVSKPCVEFGGHRQRHVFGNVHHAGVQRSKQGGLRRSNWQNAPPSPVAYGRCDYPSCPIDKSRDRPSFLESGVHRRLRKQRSFSTDIDRDEAWERKRDLYHSMDEPDNQKGRAIGRSVSDCGDRGSAEKSRLRLTSRSLTDEDLEELRGCIDLGFGFSDDESSCDLKSTFPALELYYAINRHYADIKSRSSPVSPLDRTSSGGSPHSPLSDSWRISSPGDHPTRVKARLRHWAQAVACSIKQGFSL